MGFKIYGSGLNEGHDKVEVFFIHDSTLAVRPLSGDPIPSDPEQTLLLKLQGSVWINGPHTTKPPLTPNPVHGYIVSLKYIVSR